MTKRLALWIGFLCVVLAGLVSLDARLSPCMVVTTPLPLLDRPAVSVSANYPPNDPRVIGVVPPGRYRTRVVGSKAYLFYEVVVGDSVHGFFIHDRSLRRCS